MNYEFKDNFTLEPMVSFRTAENLVVIWLEPNYTYQRTVGFKKCSQKQWEIWEETQNPDTFQSSGTSETFKINRRLTCDDKPLVYLFACKTCSKQYTEETTD